MQINKLLFDAGIQEKLRLFLHSGELSNGKVILLLGWYAGLSAENIAQLKWSDIDFSNQAIHACGRTVPLSEDLSKLLSSAEQTGAYVIYSRKAKVRPTTRKNIAWMARAELDSAGLPDITLRDLRGFYILRAIQKFPIEQVARISGCEIWTLHSIIRDNKPDAPLPKRTTEQTLLDATQFKTALEKEGDTLDTRIVWLCWQGGLTLKEMPGLYWENISFQQQTWEISGSSRKMSPEMSDRLESWEPPERRTGPVLRGKLSGKQLDPIFVTKRGEEFLIRNGFETIDFSRIRGDFYTPSAHQLSDIILDAIERKKALSEKQLLRVTGAPRKNVQQCLQTLIQDGKLRYLEADQCYLLSDVKTNKENIYEIIAEYRRLGTPLPVNVIADRLGLPENLICYYLRKAVKQGDIKKIQRGIYSCN